MAELTVQKIDLNGLSPTYAACDSAGDTFLNTTSRTFLHFKNGDTADKTVTIASLKKCDQGFIHNVVITVPAGGEVMVGAFSQIRFNDTNRKVSVSYSDVTNLTVAALDLST